MALTLDYDAWNPLNESVPRRIGGKGARGTDANVPFSMDALASALFSPVVPPRDTELYDDMAEVMEGAMAVIVQRLRQLGVPNDEVERKVKFFGTRPKPEAQILLDAARTPVARMSNPNNWVVASKPDHKYEVNELQTGVWVWQTR